MRSRPTDLRGADEREPVVRVDRPRLVDEILHGGGEHRAGERGGQVQLGERDGDVEVEVGNGRGHQPDGGRPTAVRQRSAVGMRVQTQPSRRHRRHAPRVEGGRATRRRARRARSARRTTPRGPVVRERPGQRAPPPAVHRDRVLRRRRHRRRRRSPRRARGRARRRAAIASRSASVSAHGFISATLAAKTSRSFDVIAGAAAGGAALTRRSSSGASATSRPSSDPFTCHGTPGIRSGRGDHPHRPHAEVAFLDAEAEVVAPRDVAREQHGAVGIAEIGGVGDRQERLREHAVGEIGDRRRERCGAVDVARRRDRGEASGEARGGVRLAPPLVHAVRRRRPRQSPGGANRPASEASEALGGADGVEGQRRRAERRARRRSRSSAEIDGVAALLLAHALEAAAFRRREVEPVALPFPLDARARRAPGGGRRPARRGSRPPGRRPRAIAAAERVAHPAASSRRA